MPRILSFDGIEIELPEDNRRRRRRAPQPIYRADDGRVLSLAEVIGKIGPWADDEPQAAV